MPVLGAGTLELNADSGKLERDLGATVAKATALGTAIGTALGAGIERGIGTVAELVSRAFTVGDEFNKASQKVGLAVEEYSKLAVAADLADVSTKALDSSLVKLAANAAEAAEKGGSKAARAFKALGIELKNGEGELKSTQQLFDEVAAKMALYEDSAQKSALATAMFGRSGAALIPLFNSLEETRKLAEQLGLVMSTEQAQASERFNDNMRTAKLGVDAVGRTIAAQMLPTLEKFSMWLVENAKDTERLGVIAGTADAGLKLMSTAAVIVGAVFKVAGQAIGATAALMVQFISGNFRAAATMAVERIRDLGTDIGETIGQVEQIWTQTAGRVDAGAASNGKKLAAPAMEAEAKIKKAKKSVEDFGDDLAKALSKQLHGTQNLSIEGRTLFELEDKRYNGLSASRREKILDLAREIDASKRLGFVLSQQEEDRQRAAADRVLMDQGGLRDRDAGERIRRALDPSIELNEQIRETARLMKEGFIDPETGDAFVEKLQRQIAELGTLGEKVKQTDTWAHEMGLSFSSAFEDALVGGKKLSDVLKGLAQDVARIITRRTITEPLGKAFTDSLSGSGGLMGGIKDFFGFKAAGGPVMAGGAYVVGEQGPELFTPGVSGMITPNHALGGASQSISIHIDSRTDQAQVYRLVQGAIAQANAALLDSMGRGSSAAGRAVGRA